MSCWAWFRATCNRIYSGWKEPHQISIRIMFCNMTQSAGINFPWQVRHSRHRWAFLRVTAIINRRGDLETCRHRKNKDEARGPKYFYIHGKREMLESGRRPSRSRVILLNGHFVLSQRLFWHAKTLPSSSCSPSPRIHYKLDFFF